MKHLGILAHSSEGAALCFRAFCLEGFRELGAYDHPDVTMDCIPLARCMPAWEAGDHQEVRATLAVSAERVARAARSATTSAMCSPGSAKSGPGSSSAMCAELSGQTKKSAPARATRSALTASVARTSW